MFDPERTERREEDGLSDYGRVAKAMVRQGICTHTHINFVNLRR